MAKPYNTKSLQDRLNQVSPEDGGLGRAGLYRHPESGQEAHTLSDPLFGEAQSNAFVQLGFVRIRDSKPEEIKNIMDYNVAANVGQTDSLKGLSARLDQLEGVAAENKRLEAEVEKYRKEALDRADATNLAGHAAKEDAAQKIKDRDQAPDTDPTKQVGKAPGAAPADPINSDLSDEEKAELENATGRTHVREGQPGSEDDEPEDEKPVSKQNETELKATAEAEGVDLSGAETVKAKREAILAAREGKKESEQE